MYSVLGSRSLRRQHGTKLVPNEIHALKATVALNASTGTPVHGYTLARSFKELGIVVSTSTIYRALERLSDREFLDFRWEASPDGHRGPPRKLFSPTPEGIAEAARHDEPAFHKDWLVAEVS